MMMFAKLKGYAVAAGVFLVAIIGALAYGYGEGRQKQREADALRKQEAARRGKEIENEIRGLGGVAIDERLSKWMRD